MRSGIKTSLLVISVLLLTLAFVSGIKAYYISSFDFRITPTAQTAKIGDEVLFNLCALDTTVTYANVSVVVQPVTASYIELSDLSLPASPWPLYVYDGIHTWKIDIAQGYTNAAIKSFRLNNTNLIAGWPVVDYTDIETNDFAAAEGSQASFGAASADIGSAITGIVLYDDGSAAHNDLQTISPYNPSPNDGVYNARFLVRESYGFTLKDAAIVGHFTKAGTKASNEGFIAPNRISIDGKRPTVELVNARPNPFNPNKEILKFYYYLTEDCDINLRVFYGSVTQKTLNATGRGNLTEFISWDGLSDSGVLQTDGQYSYRFDITDEAGNTGASYTAALIITTVEVVVNIQTIDTNFIPTGSESMVEVVVQVDTELRNATAANLANLGFDPALYGAGHYKLYPWAYTDLKLYSGTGTFIEAFPKDTFTDTDEDEWYISPSSNPVGYQVMDYTYDPAAPAYCSETAAPAEHTDPDAATSNDWNIVFSKPFTDAGGGIYKKSEVFVYHSASLQEGTPYVLKANAVLVGKNIIGVGDIEQLEDKCVAGRQLLIQKYHAQPSFFYDDTTGSIGDLRGLGLSADPRTAMFMVEGDPGVPIPDNTGPRVVPYSEYPSDGQVLEPGIITPTNYCKVMLTDEGVGAGTTNLSTFILKDPYGNLVPGQMAWNAGQPGTKNWEIYYIPNNPLTLGGTYNMTIVPRDAAGNQGSSYAYSFNVADTSIPVITNVNVQSSTGNTQQLSPSTSTQVTFLVSRVETTLIPGGSAQVDWTKSSIEVRTAADAAVAGSLSHTAGTNIMTFYPQAVLSDGSYRAIITAVSLNGYTGAATYNFSVSTAGVTYVNLSGTGENDTTYMRLSIFSATSSGITDSGSFEVDASDLAVTAVPPASVPANGSYVTIGSSVSFTAAGHTLPVSFNQTLCSSVMRMHYDDADVAVLFALGLTESNLTLWRYSGGTWTQITGFSAPVDSPTTTDRYVESTVLSIPAGNIYALMYAPPASSTIISQPFKNTKVFNPGTGPARIFFTRDMALIGPLGGAGNVRVNIFSINGTPVRSLEYQDPAENGLFLNSEPDIVNPAILNYYFIWDGKNDHGSLVRNGMYVMKIEVATAAGAKTTKSRTIAVIK